MSLASHYAEVLRDAFGDEESFIHDDSEEVHVARGDTLIDDGEESALKSELPNVSDECWTQFVRGMITAPVSSVSKSNALGMFELMPRRLADLGLVQKLSRTQSPEGRTIWVAIFVLPMTCEKFLKSPQVQYKTFCKSMKDYTDKMADGKIERDASVPLSGALAVLHRCGPAGLNTWSTGERFPSTVSLYDRVAGVF